MIPVAIPSAAGLLFLSLSFMAGLALIAWLLLLALSKGARRWLMSKPWIKIPCLLALAVLSVPALLIQYWMYTTSRESERREAALRVTLAQAQTIDGVAMPTGTRLVLDQEGRLDTYARADFDPPALAYGVQATQITRYLASDYDEHYNVVHRYPQGMEIRGKGVQAVQEWGCDASQPMKFDVEDKGARVAFSNCVLADGNRAGDVVLPAGAQVQARDGLTYGDGHVEPLRWVVSVDGPEPLKVAGLLLGHPALHLDARRQFVGLEYGVLACAMPLGPMRYPAGTLVRTLGYPLNRQMPEAWVFTPDVGMQVQRDDGTMVAEGSSVVQRLDGTVLAVAPNARLMIELFPKLEVGGVMVPGPVDCPRAPK
ncbi:hypothetical protein [Bordetella genomosp. 13]|uniref:hypothetical protein n=1 Tax=Bordetella genomosp. 13 TaxID=463040 RepID=UPI0011A34C3F|nr:hypothetical protein [Bordetella genomosp. 13]